MGLVMPRKKKTTRRRKKQGISLLGVAETYMLVNVATQTMFNIDPYGFLVGKSSSGYGSIASPRPASGYSVISIKELFDGSMAGSRTQWEQITQNLKTNWAKGAAGMVLIPLGFRMAKALARPAINRTNRLLMKSGVGRTVKV